MNTLTPALPTPAAPPLPAVAPPAGPPPPLPAIEPGQLFVLRNVPWASYVAISDALPDWPGLRIIYDRGRLELMSTSHLHEWLVTCLGLLVEIAADETDVEYSPGGHLTIRDEDRKRGFEPDLCFWVEAETRMRVPKGMWDSTVHPVPDLTVEIEVSQSAVPRLPVFAAYGVPEVWRTDGNTIRVLLLGPDGEYHESRTSRAFPRLPVAEMAPFLRPDADQGGVARRREFRAWLRAALAAGGSPS